MSKAPEELLGQLHGELARAFLARVRSGEASPSDLNAARQFLKDNNISCDGPRNADLNALVHSLPDVLPGDLEGGGAYQ
jgi:hypothetical protein